MKLKEKFLDYVYCFMGSGMLTNTYDEIVANWNAEKCEKIADDFAIGFAEWCVAKAMGTNNFKLYEGELEIYKKEK